MAGQVLTLHPESKILYMSGYTDNAIVHQGVLDPTCGFFRNRSPPGRWRDECATGSTPRRKHHRI